MCNVAIVKEVPETYVNALSDTKEKIDLELAEKQHKAYVEALKASGYTVYTIGKNAEFPDSVFIEDTAIITKNSVVITNPKEPSRNEEIQDTVLFLEKIFPEKKFVKIESPGTLEGGDVLFIAKHVYIGLSKRTNVQGAEQLKNILEKEGFTVHFVDVLSCLHLKTGVTFIGNNTIICSKEFFDQVVFDCYDKILENNYKITNCLLLDKSIICSKIAHEVFDKLEKMNKPVIALDISEFEKANGGVTCLSLIIDGDGTK